MPLYHKAGFVSTTAVDGRKLLVVYLHDDESRDEKMLNDEVDVMRSFAAACTNGDADVKGKTLNIQSQQCDVICVRKSQHASPSDGRPHLAVQISKRPEFINFPPRALSGLHVYSNQDDTSKGYAGWRKIGSMRKTASKMNSVAVQQHLTRAMNNNLRPGSRGPPPPSSTENESTEESR